MHKVASRTPDGMLIESVDGITEYMHYDDADQRIFHEIVQDVEPVLEHAKKLANADNAGRSASGDLRYAGSFPPVIVHEWLRLHGLTMADMKGDVITRFLNDQAHSAFRIWKGRV